MARLNRAALIAALLIFAGSCDASAGQVLDRVRRTNVMRCSAAERPVVAVSSPDGGIDGLAVTLCRAVAIAVLGRDGRISFTFDDTRHDADLAFVDAPGALSPGPVIFTDRLSVLVPVASHVRTLRDLAGETVCLKIASPEQRALQTDVEHLGINVVHLAYEEDDEMQDAYAVGRCQAMIGGEPVLAGLRGPIGIRRLTSRLLPEPLALVPVIAATSSADPEWAGLVFWVVRDLMGHGTPQRGPATATSGTPPGIRADWREDVSAILGDVSRRAAVGSEPRDR
jgi:general L-amino acid transport system substrate-binding protein